MVKRSIFSLLVALAVVLIWNGCHEENADNPAETGPLSLGFSMADITPDLETHGRLRPLGYMFNPPVKGVKDPLRARVMVLHNSALCAVWVVMDTCVIDNFFFEIVHAKVAHLVDKENLFISTTHTHGGIAHIEEQPAVQFLNGQLKPALREEVAEKVAGAIRDAAGRMRSVTMSFSRGELEQMNQNRRPFYKPPLEDRGTDKEMTTAAFRDGNDNMVAVLSNFAAHPTLTPVWEDPHFTSDFVGAFNESIERHFGDGLAYHEGGPVFSMFTNGVLGDAEPYYPDPVEREVQTWQKGIEYGNRLAQAALPIIREALLKQGDARVVLKTGISRFAMPEITPSSPLMALLFLVFPVKEYELAMKTFRLGDILVNFFIGEPTTPVGLNRIKDSLKARSGLHAVVAAPSNDYLLYVPSTEQYEESGRLSNYERLVCLFGPETDELLVEKALDSAQELY